MGRFNELKINKLYFIILLSAFAKVSYLFLFVDTIKFWEDHDIAINLLNTGVFYYNYDGMINHTYQFPLYPYIIFTIYNDPLFKNIHL